MMWYSGIVKKSTGLGVKGLILIYIYIYIYIYKFWLTLKIIFAYLAMLGLSCSTKDLLTVPCKLLVVAREI